jgi:Rieske Fe-S protein
MEPFDGLAFIGPTPGGSPSVLLATGDSGMGITHGTIAGILLTDLIAGRVHPWASLYAPSRKPSHSLLDFVRENGRTLARYASWLRPGERDVGAIAPGSGAIIQDGLRKLAVYRDESGDLHTRLARCTHLGGLVGWNDAEKTWDCPCHGARYDRYGRVLHGPASSDLAAAALRSR